MHAARCSLAPHVVCARGLSADLALCCSGCLELGQGEEQPLTSCRAKHMLFLCSEIAFISADARGSAIMVVLFFVNQKVPGRH